MPVTGGKLLNDFIGRWLAYVPAYLGELGGLLRDPKGFIARKNIGPESSLDEPLIFLAISIAIAVLVWTVTLADGTNVWETAFSLAVFTLLNITLIALVARVSWWLVGGTAPTWCIFAIYVYYSAALAVGFTVIDLFMIGILKVFDPSLHHAVMNARRGLASPPDLSSSMAGVAAAIVYGFAMMLLAMWMFYAWGAFRRVNGVGRFASGVAVVLLTILGLPVIAGMFFVASALNLLPYTVGTHL